ncbi:3TM-type holin [Bradyrhizobium sp. 150]|uniref:3TM-type holin n=1 Tax=Bradyrhizobium sp. 150 TaxID=2782625 RepID=UPI001FFBB9E8|nr:3TM-type holin [Bradyrhizobium sp. 150]MCK1670321.1 hypothetical protein [Bradyrhizobium sp. 150]
MLAGWLANLVSVPIIGAILSPILNALLTAQKQKLDAAGSHEVVVADIAQKQMDLDKREAEVNASVVIAEQGNWVTRSVRPAFALPFILFTWKVVIWDKVLGSLTNGTTDPLDQKMWGVFMAVVIAYMGGRSAENVASKIAGIFKKEK